MLTTKNLSKKGAIDPITLEIKQKERLGIVGQTGSGKSSLLKLMAGLMDPDSGEVYFQEQKVLGPSRKLVPGNEHIIYLSQYFELPKFIKVEEYLEIPFKTSEEEALHIFKACRVQTFLQRDTRELSGGEKQRVAIAKSLLKKPDVLLLDEPFSNLDFIHKQVIKEILAEIENELDTTILIVAHDPMDILSWATKVMVLKNGKVIQEAGPQEIFNYPVNEYVAGIFGSYNLITRDGWGFTDRDEFPSVDNKLIVRPHQIRITNDATSQQGKIVDIFYYGSYVELLIETGNNQILLQGKPGDHVIGDYVKMSLDSPNYIRNEQEVLAQ